MVSIFVAEEAKGQGISPDEYGVDFTTSVVERLADIETDRHDLSTIEKALHKAAGGNHELAGRLLREYMVDNALNTIIANRLVTEIQNKLRGPIAGGKKTAQVLKAERADRNSKICAAAADLQESGHGPSINSELAKRFGLSASQIRKIRRNSK